MTDAQSPSPQDQTSPATPAQGEPRKSIMRSLGEFFGHIAHAVRSDPAQPPLSDTPTRTITRQTVEEAERDTPHGRVTLRRTIIEEVELPPAPADKATVSPPPAE